jgi:isopenicillin-N epimerase
MTASSKSGLARHWLHEEGIDFLNHGSFGSCPRVVFEAQHEYQRRMLAEPVRFLTRERQGLLDRSRAALAGVIHAEPRDIAFVRNATEGVNTVAQSLELNAGDEILVTDHAYGACVNALVAAAGRAGARVVTAIVPFPIQSPKQATEAVFAAVTPRTKLLMLDHVTSPTGLIFPVAEVVAEMTRRGIDTLIDGAHVAGMLPVDVSQIGAAYYTGNCHKWLCAPLGCGFLYVRRERQGGVTPTVKSWGASAPRDGNWRFNAEFDWPGTVDFSPWLALADAIGFMSTVLPGGLAAVMKRNHELAVTGRRIVCEKLGVTPPCPEEMLGSIAAICLPDDPRGAAAIDCTTHPTPTHDLNTRLLERHGIEAPAYFFPAPPRLIVRLSAQLYNDESQYERLAAAVKQELR